jgi:hypothetical protein
MNPPTTEDQSHNLPNPADEWPRHEHVAAPAQVAAQKLVDATGSVELAKQAIEAAGEPPADAANGRDGFARQNGFASYLEMFEAAEPIADTSRAVWLLAATGPDFVVWSERDLTAIRFGTRDDALTAIQRGQLGRGARPAE